MFQRRCEARLSHLVVGGSQNPLNTTCHMWWDLFPSWGTPRRDIDDAALAAMISILELDSLACQESALHGLGHWQPAYPDRVGAAIEGLLRSSRHRDELRAYAAAAQRGCVQ